MKMKLTLAFAVFTVIILASLQQAAAQANTSLSNLTVPTAVNQNLLPGSNNVRDVGSVAKSWRTLYLDNGIYLKDSLFLHTKGSYNTFVGMQAGKSVTSGNSNTAMGYNSLYSNTTGYQNTAVGLYSLYSNTTGTDNTAFGKSTLYHNDTGSLNTGLGFQALFYNQGGAQNTASGAYAMFNNTTGSYNTASGNYSLSNNNTGQQNTSMGFYSMFSNTTGYSNTAFGKSALYSNSDGFFNAASGLQALFNNTHGCYSTASGAYALFINTTGGYNVADGYRAGNGNTIGGYNVFIGSQAGFNNVDGSNNVYVGYNSGGSAHISNAVALGANITVTNSNTIILGTNQNVGIGTTNPQYRLSVNGTIQAKEVRVETGWSDYVFEKHYHLRSLENVAAYIEENKHLPGINSAKEIQQNGLAVADMQTKMMAKIEELTLYIIAQDKSIKHLEEQNSRLETKMNAIQLNKQ